MRIVISTLVSACALVVLAPGAGATERGCPNGNSGFIEYVIAGTVGVGPAPAPGIEPLWDIAVEGVAAEGLTVEEVAEQFGFATADELYHYALEGWHRFDRNDDLLVCVKAYPEASPTPAYLFNFLDNFASQRAGEDAI